MIYLYIFIFGNGEKISYLLPLFIKMVMENYNLKLPTANISKDKYIDFFAYMLALFCGCILDY